MSSIAYYRGVVHLLIIFSSLLVCEGGLLDLIDFGKFLAEDAAGDGSPPALIEFPSLGEMSSTERVANRQRARKVATIIEKSLHLLANDILQMWSITRTETDSDDSNGDVEMEEGAKEQPGTTEDEGGTEGQGGKTMEGEKADETGRGGNSEEGVAVEPAKELENLPGTESNASKPEGLGDQTNQVGGSKLNEKLGDGSSMKKEVTTNNGFEDKLTNVTNDEITEEITAIYKPEEDKKIASDLGSKITKETNTISILKEVPKTTKDIGNMSAEGAKDHITKEVEAVSSKKNEGNVIKIESSGIAENESTKDALAVSVKQERKSLNELETEQHKSVDQTKKGDKLSKVKDGNINEGLTNELIKEVISETVVEGAVSVKKDEVKPKELDPRLKEKAQDNPSKEDDVIITKGEKLHGLDDTSIKESESDQIEEKGTIGLKAEEANINNGVGAKLSGVAEGEIKQEKSVVSAKEEGAQKTNEMEAKSTGGTVGETPGNKAALSSKKEETKKPSGMETSSTSKEKVKMAEGEEAASTEGGGNETKQITGNILDKGAEPEPNVLEDVSAVGAADKPTEGNTAIPNGNVETRGKTKVKGLEDVEIKKIEDELVKKEETQTNIKERTPTKKPRTEITSRKNRKTNEEVEIKPDKNQDISSENVEAKSNKRAKDEENEGPATKKNKAARHHNPEVENVPPSKVFENKHGVVHIKRTNNSRKHKTKKHRKQRHGKYIKSKHVHN